ncbi:MAG: hypothetical protein ACTHKS_09250 [Gaiellaceae bacterium]
MRVAALSAVVAALMLAATAHADQTTHDRVKVDGFAEAFFGCPSFFNTAGTVCRETHVEMFRENGATDGGPIGPSTWAVLVERYTLEFVSDDPNVDPIGPIDYAVGAIDDPAVTFDDQHLDYATLAASVPMSDGTTADIHATWTPTSSRQVFGNDGPYLAGHDTPRHFNEGCVTANTNAHQKVRLGIASGTLDGAPFQSYGDFPFAGWIQTAKFLLLTADHGGCS